MAETTSEDPIRSPNERPSATQDLDTAAWEKLEYLDRVVMAMLKCRYDISACEAYGRAEEFWQERKTMIANVQRDPT